MWRTVSYMVYNMENQVEECTKMIMSMVLVALRNNLKCLGLTCSGHTILKAYFSNTTCALCLWGGGEARSSLWAGLWHKVEKCLKRGTCNTASWGHTSPLRVALDRGRGGMGHEYEINEESKTIVWWRVPLLDHQASLCTSSLLLSYAPFLPAPGVRGGSTASRNISWTE